MTVTQFNIRIIFDAGNRWIEDIIIDDILCVMGLLLRHDPLHSATKEYGQKMFSHVVMQFDKLANDGHRSLYLLSAILRVYDIIIGANR